MSHKDQIFAGVLIFSLLFHFPFFGMCQGNHFNYATGNVTGRHYVGGMAGRVSGTPVLLSNSYARGSVTGESHVGGLVGHNDGTIAHSYATGRVTGDWQTGGLAGSGTGTVTASYWDTQTSQQPGSAGGAGRTTGPMTWAHAADTYTGWDFIYTWKADQDQAFNNGYPLLKATAACQVSVHIFPPGAGIVTGAGIYPAGFELQLEATPNSAYVFKGWSREDETLGTSDRLSLKLTSSMALVARFESKTTEVRQELFTDNRELKLYPNPVENELTILLPHTTAMKVDISVFNMTGQLMKCSSGEWSTPQVRINVAGLPGGLYILNVRAADGNYSGKFIKK